jgi:hypothetical protein
MDHTSAVAFAVGVVSTVTVYMFGQPAGVMAMVLGGVTLACYRNVSLDNKRKLLGWIVIGSIITSTLLELVIYILTYNKVEGVPLKPVAFILGFVLFDVQLRAWALGIIKARIERLLS